MGYAALFFPLKKKIPLVFQMQVKQPLGRLFEGLFV